MTKYVPYKKGYNKGYSTGAKQSTWVNSRLKKQNKRVIKEMNAASNSRALIKARITALTAKVSLMESEILSIMDVLNIQDGTQVVKAKAEAQKKLLKAAELLDEEE